MPRQLNTWKWIAANVQQKAAVALLYVTESCGSSPGRRGFFMAVNAAGETSGSIGGGIMEHKFIEMAKTRLANGLDGPTLFRQYHDKKAFSNQSGMICSGTQTICLCFVREKDIGPIKNLVDTLEQELGGTLTIRTGEILFTPLSVIKNTTFTTISDHEWTYREQVGIKEQLYIIGGGHCSLALSQVMDRLGFRLYLFDDRPQLSTMEANDCVYDKRVIGSYAELGSLIEPGDNSYVVIMTQGYRTDYTALSALMNLSFKYVGVLGSKSKIEKMFADFLADGITLDQLKKIHAPIGLAIKSETPEEIAISIAAEIITVKNQNSG